MTCLSDISGCILWCLFHKTMIFNIIFHINNRKIMLPQKSWWKITGKFLVLAKLSHFFFPSLKHFRTFRFPSHHNVINIGQHHYFPNKSEEMFTFCNYFDLFLFINCMIQLNESLSIVHIWGLLIVYFWLRWGFIALCGLLSSSFSVWRFLPLQSAGSRVWTQLLHGLFLEQGSIEHVSPAFAGWFFFVARKEYWTYSFPFLKPNFVSFWLCWAFVAFL